MTKQTSQRHTDILDRFVSGEGSGADWVRRTFGELQLTAWRWGEIEMDWQIDERLLMPDGVMFGGHVAAAADHIVGLVSMSVIEDSDERFRTSRLETNYFRPVMGPRARITGSITNLSRSLIHAQADIFNAEDKLAARIYAVQMRGRKEGSGK